MRKVFGTILITVITLAFGFIQVQAGAGCGSKDVEAKLTSGSKASCASAKSKYCTPEECAEWEKLCKDYDGKCENRIISIKGMTCNGCENDIKTTLSKVDGVLNVLKVSYTKEVAIVCVDPEKLGDENSLITPIVNKGYKAEFVSAVATTEDDTHAVKSGCAKTCTEAQMKACSASKDHHADDKMKSE